jgi:hypothetical protein
MTIFWMKENAFSIAQEIEIWRKNRSEPARMRDEAFLTFLFAQNMFSAT